MSPAVENRRVAIGATQLFDGDGAGMPNKGAVPGCHTFSATEVAEVGASFRRAVFGTDRLHSLSDTWK